MQTQYFNFLHIEISYRMMHGINDELIENTSIIILYLHCNRTLWRVPDSEGTIARHQPGFLTSHDRQKPKKKKKYDKKIFNRTNLGMIVHD